MGRPALWGFDQLAVKLVPVRVPVVTFPVIVTCAVAVAVEVPGAYCTLIVQLPPGATTEPLAQVPPVIVKVPPAGPTLTIAGVAVRISSPAALLLTVMMPVFVDVLAAAVVNAGLGAPMVTPASASVPFSVEVWVPTESVTEIVAGLAPGA